VFRLPSIESSSGNSPYGPPLPDFFWSFFFQERSFVPPNFCLAMLFCVPLGRFLFFHSFGREVGLVLCGRSFMEHLLNFCSIFAKHPFGTRYTPWIWRLPGVDEEPAFFPFWSAFSEFLFCSSRSFLSPPWVIWSESPVSSLPPLSVRRSSFPRTSTPFRSLFCACCTHLVVSSFFIEKQPSKC